MEQALHASAPQGYKCADCTIDKEACPTCYRVWWAGRHPTTTQVAPRSPERQAVLDALGVLDAPSFTRLSILFLTYTDRAYGALNVAALAYLKTKEAAEG